MKMKIGSCLRCKKDMVVTRPDKKYCGASCRTLDCNQRKGRPTTFNKKAWMIEKGYLKEVPPKWIYCIDRNCNFFGAQVNALEITTMTACKKTCVLGMSKTPQKR